MSDHWSPFDPSHSAAQIERLLEYWRSSSHPLIDLGCGDGRVLVPLARAGHTMIGVDRDSSAITACRHRLHELGLDASLIELDFEQALDQVDALFGGVLCLGNTLMQITSLRQLRNLFAAIRRRLAPHGAFIIDDFSFELWDDITEGNWRAGVSDDDSQQIVFAPGDPVFALREGEAIDESSWRPKSGEQLFRLWSNEELRFLASENGFQPPQHRSAAHLIVFPAGDLAPGR